MQLLHEDKLQAQGSHNSDELDLQYIQDQSMTPNSKKDLCQLDSSNINKNNVQQQPQSVHNSMAINSHAHLVSIIDGKEQFPQQSFERLKTHSKKQNNHFKQQIPAIQNKGDEDNESNRTAFKQVDSIKDKDSSSLYTNSYGRGHRESHSAQNDIRTNSLYPETKQAIAKIQRNKKSADLINSYHESGDEELRQNRKDSKFLSVYVPSVYKQEEGSAVGNDNLSISKYQKSGYLSKRGDGSFQRVSDQQESINQGTKSFRDDISELQQTIMNRPRLGLNLLWKKRSLSIIQKVARFINIMLFLSIKKRFKQLRKQDFELIGDCASSYKYYLYQDQFETQVIKYSFLFQFSQLLLVLAINCPIFFEYRVKFQPKHHTQKEFIGNQSNIISLICNHYFLEKKIVTFPMKVCMFKVAYQKLIMFISQMQQNKNQYLFLISYFINLMKVRILNYWRLIMKLKENYCKLVYKIEIDLFQRNKAGQPNFKLKKDDEDLLLDLITLIPYLSGALGLSKYLLLLIILKAYRLTLIRRHLIETIQPGEKTLIIIRIINVFLLIFFIAHIVSTGFVWVAMQQYKTPDDYDNIITWISKAGLLTKSWSEIYLNGLYWAIISMQIMLQLQNLFKQVLIKKRITIGYGDITPQTLQEKAYTVSSNIIKANQVFGKLNFIFITFIVSMISCAVFAYCINTISQIITDLKQKQKKLKERIKNLNSFLDTRGLDKHLQIKVRKFIEHVHISEEYEGSAIKDLEIIPKQIKQEVQIDIYGRIIRKIKLFLFNFSEEAINNLALKVTEQNFAQGEYIFKQGEQSEKMYILMQGRIELSFQMKNKDKDDTSITIFTVEKDQIFGVEEFFGEKTRSFSAKALDLSRVIEISQKNIIQAFQQSSQCDIEKFQMMRDKVKFANTPLGLVQCYYCSRFTHSYKDCPNVAVSKNKLLCLAKYNYSQSIIERKPFQRIGMKINSIASKPFLSNSVHYYLHYRQYQDNNKQTDGFTEDTIDNVRQRNISNFSYHMNSQRNIFKNYKSGNDTNNQTSIKLAAVPNPQNPSLMMVEALDPLQLQQLYTHHSDSLLDDKSPIGGQRINLRTIRQKSREHSVNRIQKRNLTNIVEERSFINDTNITSQPSQFQSNLNAMSTTANNIFLRNSSGIRNLTWNGVQQIIQYQQQQQSSKLDSSLENLDSAQQKSPSLVHYQLSPSLIPSNIIINNSHNSIPANPASSINVNYNNSAASVINNNYVTTNNSAFGTNIQNDLAGRQSSNYISLNEKRNSILTPKNNAYSNLTNNFAAQPFHAVMKDGIGQIQNPNQTQSQQLIQNTQNSNQYSNSDLNGIKNQLNNNELIIEIQSIRNIKATSSWENETMRLFDKYKIYQHYFPYNNIDKVLVRVNGSYFLVQQKRERNKKKLSLKKLMKKNSIMIEGGLNNSKKNNSKKFSLNNMDFASININKPGSPSRVKDKDSQYLYTKDKSLSGGQNMRQHKFSQQDSTTLNHPI